MTQSNSNINLAVDIDQHPDWLEPDQAAQMAQQVYGIRDQATLEDFLSKPEFQDLSQDELTNKKGVASGSTGANFLAFKPFKVTSDIAVCVMGQGDYSGEAFIIVRGTDLTFKTGLSDILTDARATLSTTLMANKVHTGFYRVFLSIEKALNQFLQGEAQKARVIHVMGHSLGGAVANIIAEDIKRQNRSRNVKLYTFGSPRVGFFDGFADWLTHNMKPENIMRVFHSTDAVPMLPTWPFFHTEGGYYLDFQTYNPFAAHSIDNYYKHSLERGAWASMGADYDPLSNSEKIKNWLNEDVSLNPVSLKTWQWLSRALAWIMKEIAKTGLSLATMGAEVLGFGLFSLADLLKKFMDKFATNFEEHIHFIMRFFIKLGKLFGMTPPESIDKLDKAFMERALRRLEAQMEQKARDAIRQHNQLYR